MRSYFVLVVTMTVACSGIRKDGGDAGDAGGDAPSCPDMHGAYSIVLTGVGCGDLSSTAPQCIQQVGCSISFISNPASAPRALNGSTTIGADGSFTNAVVTEGTSSRSGCTGTWDANSQTLTVDCGGTGSSQSCSAALTRTGPTCN